MLLDIQFRLNVASNYIKWYTMLSVSGLVSGSQSRLGLRTGGAATGSTSACVTGSKAEGTY